MQRFLSLLVLAGCADPNRAKPDQGDTADEVPTGDVTVTVPQPEGCEVDEAAFVRVEAEVTDIPTVIRVSWATDVETTGYVVYEGEVSSVERTTPTGDPSTEHEVLLLGLVGSETVFFRVVGETEDGSSCTAEQSTTTGAIASDLPELTAQVFDDDALLEGFTTLSVMTASRSHIAILDSQGRYVWTHSVDGLVTGAQLSRDRQAVVYDRFSSTDGSDPQVVRMGLDGTELGAATIPGAHTDFDETEDGYVALGWEVREFGEGNDVRKILGDTIVRHDGDGVATEIWNAFDHFEVDLGLTYTNSWYTADPEVEDWSHANGISYDPTTGSVLVSVSTFNTILAVDLETGEQLWSLQPQGEPQDVDPDVYAPRFSIDAPHSVRRVDEDSILVFNRNSGANAFCGEASVLTLGDGFATVESDYTGDGCFVVPYLGEALALPGGYAQTTWTTSGQIDQSTPEGETVWRLNSELGAAFGFGSFDESLYPDAR